MDIDLNVACVTEAEINIDDRVHTNDVASGVDTNNDAIAFEADYGDGVFDINNVDGASDTDNDDDGIETDQHHGGFDTDNVNGSVDTDNDDHISHAIMEMEAKLQPGTVVHSLPRAFILYCEYGRLVGFSVRKGGQDYFRQSTEVRMKEFVCHCAGQPDGKASLNRLAQYRKQQRRTCCRARLRIVRALEGPWRITIFEKEHNHELAESDQSYLLRSARHITEPNASILETFAAAGIGVSKSLRYLAKETGSVQNIGFTARDAYDHHRRTKVQSRLPYQDAACILEYLKNKNGADPFFYWNIMLDDEGRLMNFFMRDTRSAADYQSFGDVLTVDTTFKTNKYNLVCAPFVGVNHHRSNVMFGIGFMSDETSASFEWLFASFLESMGGKEPQIIFSDQCQALMNGIDYSFRTAAHRLCQWHINRNAPSHFGKLNGNNEFKKMWYKCMNGCETEEEFEDTWHSMMAKYDLSKKSWFTGMYNLRRRWSSVFTNDRDSDGTPSGFIKDAALAMVHKFIAFNVSGKEQANKVNSNEVYLLWCAKNKQKIRITDFIWSTFKAIQTRKGSKPALCQIVTGIAIHLKLIDPNGELPDQQNMMKHLMIDLSELKGVPFAYDDKEIVPFEQRHCVRDYLNAQLAKEREAVVAPSTAQQIFPTEDEMDEEDERISESESPELLSRGVQFIRDDVKAFRQELTTRLDKNDDSRLEFRKEVNRRFDELDNKFHIQEKRISNMEAEWANWTSHYPLPPPRPEQ